MLTIKEYKVTNSEGGNFININKNFHYIFNTVKEDMNVLEFDNYEEAIELKEYNSNVKYLSICSGSELIDLFKTAFGENICIEEIVISKHYRITD